MLEPEYPTMFHYVLEMHKNGKSLMRLELNVPIAALPPVKMAAFVQFEAILTEYGLGQGFQRRTEVIKEPEPTAAIAASDKGGAA